MPKRNSHPVRVTVPKSVQLSFGRDSNSVPRTATNLQIDIPSFFGLACFMTPRIFRWRRRAAIPPAKPAVFPGEDRIPGSQDYITGRLRQYQTWYDGKAVKCKKRYLQMRTGSVVGGALVPALINVQWDWMAPVTTAISLGVVVLVSLESVYHYREQWKNYRSTEQYLGHEAVYFAKAVGVYKDLDDATALETLVERTESAIAAENASTLSSMTLAEQVSTNADYPRSAPQEIGAGRVQPPPG